jgi:hypothetical protein
MTLSSHGRNHAPWMFVPGPMKIKPRAPILNQPVVLLVEDEPLVRLTQVDILREAGFWVLVRIPTKPSTSSNLKPSRHSDFKPSMGPR